MTRKYKAKAKSSNRKGKKVKDWDNRIIPNPDRGGFRR